MTDGTRDGDYEEGYQAGFLAAEEDVERGWAQKLADVLGIEVDDDDPEDISHGLDPLLDRVKAMVARIRALDGVPAVSPWQRFVETLGPNFTAERHLVFGSVRVTRVIDATALDVEATAILKDPIGSAMDAVARLSK